MPRKACRPVYLPASIVIFSSSMASAPSSCAFVLFIVLLVNGCCMSAASCNEGFPRYCFHICSGADCAVQSSGCAPSACYRQSVQRMCAWQFYQSAQMVIHMGVEMPCKACGLDYPEPYVRRR